MEGFGISGLLLISNDSFRNYFTFIYYYWISTQDYQQGLLAAFCIATAFIFHFDFNDQMQLIAFLKNIGLAGGFLFILANGV